MFQITHTNNPLSSTGRMARNVDQVRGFLWSRISAEESTEGLDELRPSQSIQIENWRVQRIR